LTVNATDYRLTDFRRLIFWQVCQTNNKWVKCIQVPRKKRERTGTERKREGRSPATEWAEEAA
jgi:hypothetical protein